MAANPFSEEEVTLCTYIAVYGPTDFSIKVVRENFSSIRTLASYIMKIQNIVALLDAEGIPRSELFTPLSGQQKGEQARRTNWDWIKPLVTLSQKEFFEKCKYIFSKKGGGNNMLANLNELKTDIEKSYVTYNPDKELLLPTEFQNKYMELLQRGSLEITYSKYTSVITTSEKLTIVCPNQWFYIASFFSPYISALEIYKKHFYEIFNDLPTLKKKEKISNLRDSKSIELDDMKKIKTYFTRDEDVENFTMFLCNYEWWSGSKTIDRGDYYVSAVLSLANVVNVTQAYIAEIAYNLAKYPKLQELLADKVIVTPESEEFFSVNETEKGSNNFPLKNILLKGVPGTGKSHLIDKIITDKNKLDLQKNDHNILRINIHSASSNADLMQGIGISTKKDQIIYSEKQGLILNHIRKAITSPKQPFAIVLEEIQENSLNELIGDLIYLIEDSKRTDLSSESSLDFTSMESFIEDYVESNPKTYYVEIPYLVSTETRYKKMILPDNLYIFCTSNYRDDKKVIEDNLLRRFEVIEVYPAYKETIGDDFKSTEVSDFLKKLNDEIVKHFHANGEIHPDRFIIGHAIWLDVIDNEAFYAKLLKVVTEFKDIKELDFESDLKPLLAAIDNYPFEIKKNEFQKNNYKDLVEYLQSKCYSDLFGNSQEQPVEIKISDDSEEKVDTAATMVDILEETNKDGANADQLD